MKLDTTLISSDGPSPSKVTLKARFASEADEDHVIAMAKAFFAASPYSGVEFDEEAVRVLFQKLLIGGCVIVNERGFIAGALTPLFFAPHLKMATELAWWAPEGGGTELRELFEEWAVDNNASGVQMSALNNSYAGRLTANLAENGYTPIEVSYLKAL
jgi:hypothetical protein